MFSPYPGSVLVCYYKGREGEPLRMILGRCLLSCVDCYHHHCFDGGNTAHAKNLLHHFLHSQSNSRSNHNIHCMIIFPGSTIPTLIYQFIFWYLVTKQRESLLPPHPGPVPPESGMTSHCHRMRPPQCVPGKCLPLLPKSLLL